MRNIIILCSIFLISLIISGQLLTANSSIDKKKLDEMKEIVRNVNEKISNLHEKINSLNDRIEQIECFIVNKKESNTNSVNFFRPIMQKRWTNKYDIYFKESTKKYFGIDFDWYWFKSQSLAESGLDPNAESWVGAKGLMQIMPSTFNELSHKLDIKNVLLTNPKWNIAVGIFYDRKLYDEWTAERPFKDRMSFTFGSYNAGLGNILKGQRLCNKQNVGNCNLWQNIAMVAHNVQTWRSEETLEYVKRIFKFMGYNN